MSYDYKTERAELFTEQGQVEFLKVRDRAYKLLNQAGAFTFCKLNLSGESWFQMACLDRLVELGELIALRELGSCFSQHQVYTLAKITND